MASSNVVKLNDGLAKALKKVSVLADLEDLTITIFNGTYIIEYGNFELTTGDPDDIEKALCHVKFLNNLGADFECN